MFVPPSMASPKSCKCCSFPGCSNHTKRGRSVLNALLKGVLSAAIEETKDGSVMASVRKADDLKAWSVLQKHKPRKIT